MATYQAGRIEQVVKPSYITAQQAFLLHKCEYEHFCIRMIKIIMVSSSFFVVVAEKDDESHYGG
jgi:hypothetical protein